MVALEEFVAQALVDVATGVQSAQQRLGTSGTQINPPRSGDLAAAGSVVQTGPRSFAQLVEFDLCVAADGNRLVVCPAGENEGGSRLKFAVPVAFPAEERESVPESEPEFELAVDPGAALEDEPTG